MAEPSTDLDLDSILRQLGSTIGQLNVDLAIAHAQITALKAVTADAPS